MPAARSASRLERHDAATGAWVVVEAGGDRLRVRTGVTGNRIDPDRRVPRSCWEIRRIAGAVELQSTWPVSELVTHRIGEQVEHLADDLARAGGDVDADLAAVAEALAAQLGHTAGGAGLEDRLWAAVYPLLRVPLKAGARLQRVPVVLDRILRAPDARRAAQLAFGRVTRPLVRALAASLLPTAPGRPIPFEPALLALMAGPWCGPEQLTGVLATPPHRPGAVAFDVGEIDRSRALFEGVPARRVADHLRRALAEPDGTHLLAEEIAEWRPPVVPRPAGVVAAPAARRAPAPVTTLRPPPRTDVALRHPGDLRSVHGLDVAGHRLVLPRTADELVAWGRALDNCLGGYRHAVAEGRAHVIGLRSPAGLRYVLELTRGRSVRQFEGPGNRQAPESVAGPVIAALRARGVVRADARRGRSLLAPA